MFLAYLLVNASEYDPELMRAIRKIRGVEEAYALHGVYGIIVNTRADTMGKIKEIHNKIRKLRRVIRTMTMITHEE